MNGTRTLGDRIGMIAKLETFSAVALLIVAGPGHRFGFIPTKIALLLTLAALAIGAIALIFALLAMFMKSGNGSRAGTMIALVISGALTATLVSWVVKGASVPRIHDITTDLESPPQFVALAGARDGAANPDAYPGEQVATQQRAAYPDIKPLTVSGKTLDSVAAAARKTAADQGWEVVTSADGTQIEATDTTFWFGYKDDVIVRVTQTGDSVTVDVRSKSRVGESDLGTNAARINDYLADLQQALGAG